MITKQQATLKLVSILGIPLVWGTLASTRRQDQPSWEQSSRRMAWLQL